MRINLDILISHVDRMKYIVHRKSIFVNFDCMFYFPNKWRCDQAIILCLNMVNMLAHKFTTVETVLISLS